jgi:glycine cleavage system H protein
MKKNASKKRNVLSTDERDRCIWMTAGVISFKLCPFNYDCENCDLDEAMRSQVKPGGARSGVPRRRPQAPSPPEERGESKKSLLFFTFSVGEIEKALYLHPSHLWARRAGDNKWRLGIDQLLAYVLPPPTGVELYGLDENIAQNQGFGKIHARAGTVLLTAPFSGRLIQENSTLVQHPEVVQQDPYGKGWLAMMEGGQDPGELEEFHTGLAGKKFLEEEAQHLKFLLKHKGVQVDHIGDTMRDGGVDIKYLHQILPGQVCLRLAGELMVTEKQAW